ncbi:MAG: sugar ABC transporter permease [Thermobacillus sp.]|jgi:ABC-type polysaccharide transport system, permease component|uniref:ABC transporter permease n=1 Tax=Thermobacillus sp. TaxID=2108467 RepID=UPI000E3B1BBB|nr:ABC transporter permease subunit [Thermobacillus sp.]REJ12617.1 MAG: sugar ABC transporter permease [Paenibacillaceae bacterium]REK55964.1 MAG: sugar ABC transporter permease [Thermobacillus sp.]
MNQSRWRKFRKRVVRHRMLILMALPGLAYLVINNYLPMLGVTIAFKEIDYSRKGLFNLLFGHEWIGFKNFEYLFRTDDAYTITRNTILYNGLFIVLNTVVAIAVAIVLNEIRSRFMSRLYQSLILLPYLISMVIVGYLALSMLNVENGFMNKTILPLLGIDPVSWYSEPAYWPYILTFVNLWKNVGYLCIIYLAAIVGINHEYYEAAVIDGASKWQQITRITVPLIAPTITIMMLLAVGRIFYSDFGLFYQVPLNSGALKPTTDVIDTYVYRGLMTLGDIGMSSAAGLYQSAVGFVLILLSNWLVRRRSRDQALF